jgi:hypothetical protein
MTPEMSSLSPPETSPATLPNSMAWMISLAVSVAAFLAPALWNGFALVFFDTGGYVRRVLAMELTPGRSLFYGLFLWVSSFGWWFFYGPILLQALAGVWMVHLTLRCHDLPAGPRITAFFCVGLGLVTGIGWSTGQLMPDALVPLVVLALWLLGFRWQRLGPFERVGLTALALLGLLSHMSGLALAIGLLLVTVMARLVTRVRGWSLPVNWLPPVAIVTAALVLMPMLHLFLVGKAAYTPGGPVYIFGRLVQAGIAQRWLAEHCPIPGIKLCNLQDRIPKTGDEFLWAGTSPFRDIGEWSGAADAELGHLVKMCLKTYPVAVAWTALQATAEQMVMVKTGDQLAEIHNDTRNVFTHLLPSQTAVAFNAARQQQGGITQSLIDVINRVHVPVAHLSVLCLLLVVGWGVRSGRHDLAAMALFTLLALLGNAFICGALSNPHDRYQSRLVWLAPLVVGMSAMGWWQLRVRSRQV